MRRVGACDEERIEEMIQEALAEDDFLNADAPPKAVCDVCHRKSWVSSWTPTSLPVPCGMPQPDGSICSGMLEPVSQGRAR
jgi:hypothetical protein